ncbi:MAG TPA: hypothetical protein VK099_06405 [Alcanivoracaceae bacterium]|nr:hypothetical protein [Alcanivoracaceae bacterium]
MRNLENIDSRGYAVNISNSFDLGFDPKLLPVELTDKSYGNDVSPSFYFRAKESYFVLWVEEKDKNLRELEGSARYTLVHGVNLGDEESPEIYDDHNKGVVLSTESFFELEEEINRLIS